MNKATNNQQATAPMMLFQPQLPPEVQKHIESNKHAMLAIVHAAKESIDQLSLVHGYTVFRGLSTIAETTLLKHAYEAANMMTPEVESWLNYRNQQYMFVLEQVNQHTAATIFEQLNSHATKRSNRKLVNKFKDSIGRYLPG